VEDRKSRENKAMVIPFLISLGATIILFLWTKTKKPIDSRLRAARKRVAASSLGPTVGFGITALSFIFADKLGDKFVIAWGLVVFGIFFFIRGIMDYLKVKKSLKNAQ
jgi:hypothetical protein